MTTRTGRPPARKIAVPAVALTLLLAMAGCSDDDEGGNGEAEPTRASDTLSDSPSTNTTSPPDLPVPPKLRNSAGAVSDVTWDVTTCATDAGEQTVEGTVTNPTDGPADYVISLSWTNATSDVLGLGIGVVRDLGPGDEADWTLTGDVADGAEMCVINVMRGKLAKKNQC